ncbi:MAG TPA: choice-of-anchor Q domain-containing protein [Rhodanobacteraceae bacterium]|nr:choice-of-anchor Q domain-containing protein [Rhodanobacteraceae bacterium]
MHEDLLADSRGVLSVRSAMRQLRYWMQAVCVAVLAMAWATTASAVCYVNGAAGGANTGASWADAYTLLQSALIDVACSEVWVAQYTYKPVVPANVGSVTPTERGVSFAIRPGVAVYGGFLGNEASRAARDPLGNVTILSGDLDNNDNLTDGADADASDIVGTNTRHIVVLNGTTGASITATTVLDGFTLTGGDNSNNNEGGGALWCRGSGAGHECSPVLANLVFSGNKATNGGAMALDGYSGGGSNPTLTDVTFSGNSASMFGGALYDNGQSTGTGGTASPALTRVTFSGNSSAFYGGAMFNDGSNGAGAVSSPTLTNVVFNNNIAAMNGGAMYNNGAGGASSPTLTNVTFFNNQTTTLDGGAMYNRGGSSGTSSPTLINVTFSGNKATSSNGGAMFSDGTGGTSSPKLVNATFNGNSATSGGALYNQGGATTLLISSILWGDSASVAGAEFFSSVGETSLYNSIVQGGCVINCGGISISTSNPILGSLAYNGGFAPTMMPGVGSPAIDAIACGYANETPLTDARGAVRPDSASSGPTRCDIGAVEANSLPGDLIFADRFGSSPWDDF